MLCCVLLCCVVLCCVVVWCGAIGWSGVVCRMSNFVVQLMWTVQWQCLESGACCFASREMQIKSNETTERKGDIVSSCEQQAENIGMDGVQYLVYPLLKK